MGRWILGRYNVRNLTVLFISIGLYLLGVFSCVSNGVFFLIRLKNYFDLTNLVFTLIAIPPVIGFALYYILIGFKRKFHNKLVSFSFTFYSLSFYVISKAHHLMPYILIICTIIMLYCSFDSDSDGMLAVVLCIWLVFGLLSMKLLLSNMYKLEISREIAKDYYLILSLVFSGIVLALFWLLYSEIMERIRIKRLLKKETLTPMEIKITMFVLHRFTKNEIDKKLHKAPDNNTFYNHASNIKKKLNINDFSREGVLQKVYNI